MTLRTYRPLTPAARGTAIVDKRHLWRGGPLKSLVKGRASTGGRCASGRLTARNQGGGHRMRYRSVDFLRRSFTGKAVVERLEYDPVRTAFLALVSYGEGRRSYILAPDQLSVGDYVEASESADIKPGNALPLAKIPQGTQVHNVEMKPLKGGQIGRAAGASLSVMGKDESYVLLKMPSGEVRKILGVCWATVGTLSNKDKKNESLGSAGRSRHRGRRPHVRGVAKNPFDHPHGGGEGKTSGGRHPVSPWGQPTKGKRTRCNKRTQKFIVKRR